MSNSTSSEKCVSKSRSSCFSSKSFSRSAPFDTLREYIEALEERGLVLRFEKLDQVCGLGEHEQHRAGGAVCIVGKGPGR